MEGPRRREESSPWPEGPGILLSARPTASYLLILPDCGPFQTRKISENAWECVGQCNFFENRKDFNPRGESISLRLSFFQWLMGASWAVPPPVRVHILFRSLSFPKGLFPLNFSAFLFSSSRIISRNVSGEQLRPGVCQRKEDEQGQEWPAGSFPRRADPGPVPFLDHPQLCTPPPFSSKI